MKPLRLAPPSLRRLTTPWLHLLAPLAATLLGSLPGTAAAELTSTQLSSTEPLAAAGQDSPTARPARGAEQHEEFQAGVCWVGSSDRASLQRLAEEGVNWVAVTPFAYGQKAFDQPPEPGFQFSRFQGESPDGIREVIRDAHACGLQVLLKPHVWFSRDGKWRADIAMAEAADWPTWFRAYQGFLAPFVSMAREEGVKAFCIGTELHGTLQREDDWRRLIRQVRAKFPGQLTYAANWYEEYEQLAFWDALDLMGVQAYFPLTEEGEPSVEQLADGWAPWIEKLREAAARTDKRVLFTEFGYKPRRATAIRPWEWTSEEPFTPSAQADAYQAALLALQGQDWLAGIHLWKWYPGTGRPSRRRAHDNFSPQGLEGEAVILRAFRQLRGLPERPRDATPEGEDAARDGEGSRRSK